MAVGAYSRVQYEPPVPQVFGTQAPDLDLPKYEPNANQQKFEGQGLPSSRMKLKDRLALYEEDDPGTQKWICCLGFLFPPFIWCVGAVMYLWTPPSKTLTREAGYKNLLLACVSAAIMLMLWGAHHVMM